MLSGEPDSQWHVNQVASEYRHPHLALRSFNLYGFAPMSEDWAGVMRLQVDNWGGGDLNPLRVAAAYLHWQPQTKSLEAKIGRFPVPFGLYPSKNLPEDQDIALPPLIYSYSTNISVEKGAWLKAGSTGSGYGSSDNGMPTVHFGGYLTGIGGTIRSANSVWSLSTALSGSTPSSYNTTSNFPSAALTGRLGAVPSPYWDMGFSYSYGTFMHREGVNEGVNDLSRYRQLLVGGDLTLTYTYFEISGEVVYSTWQTPGWDGVWIRESSGDIETQNLANLGWYVDLKVEPPFATGLFLVGRFEQLTFMDLSEPAQVSATNWSGDRNWDNDVMRGTVGLGYKLSRQITLKVMASSMTIDTTPAPELGMALTTVTAWF